MKNRHIFCGGSFMLDRQCFQCGDLAMLPEVDAKTGIVFMNFGK